METNLTLSGIDEALNNLSYIDKNTPKAKLVKAVRACYKNPQDLSRIKQIPLEFLVSKVWDITPTDKIKINSKNKNAISLKNAINKDLQKLFDSGKNPEGIIISNSNIFAMSDNAKEKILSSFTSAFSGDKEISLSQISDVLSKINDFIQKNKAFVKESSQFEAVESLLGEIKENFSDNKNKSEKSGDGTGLIDEDVDDDSEIIDEEIDDDTEIIDEEIDDNVEIIDEDIDDDAEIIEDDTEIIDEDIDDDAEIIDEDVDDDSEIIDEEIDDDTEIIDEEIDNDTEIIDEEIDDDTEIIDEEVDDDAEIIEEEVDDDTEIIDEEIDNDTEIIDEEIDDDTEIIDENDFIELDGDEELVEADEIELGEDEELVDADEDNFENKPVELGLPSESLGEFESYLEKHNIESRKLLSEKFDSYLGAMDRYYNQFIVVEKGIYKTGSPFPGANMAEEKKIQIEQFYIGAFPVTNALFEIFTEKTGYKTTAEIKGFSTVFESRYRSVIDPETGKASTILSASGKSKIVRGACWHRPKGPGSDLHMKRAHPVVHISIKDALSFAAWTGKRLPSEFEWEAASRTKKGFAFPWGNKFMDFASNIENSGKGDTTPVDEYIKSVNENGIADTLGNVWEWTTQMSEHTDKNFYIAKGGSFVSNLSVRLWSRFFLKPDFTANILGFRCITD
ncbi:MAG: hypothetical protein CSA18_01160 [Deltaproteobacteria bacterium]|nr:MAG: hypothetical protein CSA18_01160 [Deltaproteobacteria bacterium]